MSPAAVFNSQTISFLFIYLFTVLVPCAQPQGQGPCKQYIITYTRELSTRHENGNQEVYLHNCFPLCLYAVLSSAPMQIKRLANIPLWQEKVTLRYEKPRAHIWRLCFLIFSTLVKKQFTKKESTE